MAILFKENKMFRVLMGYQFFSSIGGAMFNMFILLSVHLIYQNPMYTGIAGFLMAAPRVLSFMVGPVVDRRNKVAIMRMTTFLELLVLSLLAFTPLQEQLGVLFMFAVILGYGVAALFEIPASTAFLPQIVPEDKIMTANSLINIVSMVGGVTIGAVLLVHLGGDINFRFLYGFSAVFLAFTFVASLFLRNPESPESTAATTKVDYVSDLKEGARFIRQHIVLYVILAMVVMSLFGEVAFVNRPMFVEYHAGAQGYILIILMILIGGIGASYFVGLVGDRFKIGRFIFVLLMFAGVVRVAFALILPVAFVGGLVTAVFYAALIISVDIVFSSINQKVPPNNMVGRAGTIASTLTAVFTTIGALAGGFLGSIVPVVDHIFIGQGLSYIVIGLALLFVPGIRLLPKMGEIKKVDECGV